MDDDLRALERDKAALARERQAIKAAEAEFREREEALQEREEQFRRKVNDRIEDRVREARREIDAVVADLKKRTSVLADRVTRQPAAPRLTTGDAGSARAAGAGGDRGSGRAAARGRRCTRPRRRREPVEQRPAVVGDGWPSAASASKACVVVDSRQRRPRSTCAASGCAPR